MKIILYLTEIEEIPLVQFKSRQIVKLPRNLGGMYIWQEE